MRRYQVSFEVGAENIVDACDMAKDITERGRAGVGLTVREMEIAPPATTGILWSVTVAGMHDDAPCELMLTFDPQRRRGVVILMRPQGECRDGREEIATSTPILLAPRALYELVKGVELWPEDIIARLRTEDIIRGGK